MFIENQTKFCDTKMKFQKYKHRQKKTIEFTNGSNMTFIPRED